LAAYDSFDDRYLGAKSSDPSVDNDGNALTAGSLYFNSVDNVMKLWTGSAWVAAYVSGAGFMDLSSSQTAAGTKTFSSNPILSGGTANGVAYLNGSKVLTTGSALTFDGSKLVVNTASDDILRLTATAPYLSFYNGATRTGYIRANTSGTFGIVSEDASTPMAFYTAGAEVMRLSTLGNLGLGVTPSAWSGSSKAIQVQRGTLNSYANLDLQLGQNYYYDGTNNKYVANGFASYYSQYNGSHIWNTAASGTAGNAITFTQAMTLDASGNLGIGTTSPINNGGYGGFSLNGTSGALLSMMTNGTESSRIASIGDLTSVQCKASTGYITFVQGVSGGTERARIDSSGNLLVGTTSDLGAKFNASSGTRAWAGWFQQVNNAGNSVVMVEYSTGAPNNTSDYFGLFRDTGGQRIQLRSNGGIANYTANDVNLSDRREKTNFAPAGSYLDKICAIPVQTFNYIDQNLEEDGGLTLGVVAQDVQAVAPELVSESNWANKDEEPKMRLSIYQTDLQYALMKCIQEQQALITQLTARITALEAT